MNCRPDFDKPIQSWGMAPAWMTAMLLLSLLTWADTARSQERGPTTARQDLERLSQAFHAASQQVRPAVVLITTTRRRSAAGSRMPPFHSPPPEDEEPRRMPPFHPPLPEDGEPTGLGSGIVVSADGYILSNHHVIAGSNSIRVTLADRRTFAAEVVGSDSLIDIVLLKIDATELPTVRLGNVEELQIGDWVLAIGHPLGMGSTLTHGIVSALGRQAQVIGDDYGIESFIQTDAAINPGNSGGPLLNLHGEVVGINTAISTRTGYYMGYGLAVPIDLAQEAMRDILDHGRVVRGYLGVTMDEVDQERMRELDLDMELPRGIHIRVLPDSPAERGGLQDGDIILAVDGHQVDRPNQVQTLIYGLNPGQRVDLTVLRAGTRRQLRVVLGEREEDRLLARGRGRMDRLGLTVEPLSGELAGQLGFTPEVAEQLGFAPGEAAVVVVQVEPGGLAAARGIAVHDVITEVDVQRITSLPQLVRTLSEFQAGETALFWLWRPRLGVDMRVLKIPQ